MRVCHKTITECTAGVSHKTVSSAIEVVHIGRGIDGIGINHFNMCIILVIVFIKISDTITALGMLHI